MENPYHKAEIKPHHLDQSAVRVKCFDVFNIISASVALGGEHEMIEPEEEIELPSMFRLHHELAEPRLSQLLLDIAVFVRTFDDLMTSVAPEEYAEHSSKTDGAGFIGTIDGERELRIRDACNKIIHATDFRPVYDNTERALRDGAFERVWHLDGQIELQGIYGKKSWEAVLYVQPFLETVLNRLDFAPPD